MSFPLFFLPSLRIQQNCHTVKFADDTVLLCLHSGHRHHSSTLQNSEKWYGNSCLKLNVNKYKEMIVTFSETETDTWGSQGELVEEYKYLRTIFYNLLKFFSNKEEILTETFCLTLSKYAQKSITEKLVHSLTTLVTQAENKTSSQNSTRPLPYPILRVWVAPLRTRTLLSRLQDTEEDNLPPRGSSAPKCTKLTGHKLN